MRRLFDVLDWCYVPLCSVLTESMSHIRAACGTWSGLVALVPLSHKAGIISDGGHASNASFCMVLIIDYMPGLQDKSKKSKAERIAFDLLEYLDQINYNKYYDSMGSPGTRGGEKEKLFSDFSSQSINAAQVSA